MCERGEWHSLHKWWSLILKLDKVELGETNIFSLGNLENSFDSSKYYVHTCFLEMFAEENDFTYDR